MRPYVAPKSQRHLKPGELIDIRVREVIIELADGADLLIGLPVDVFIEPGLPVKSSADPDTQTRSDRPIRRPPTPAPARALRGRLPIPKCAPRVTRRRQSGAGDRGRVDGKPRRDRPKAWSDGRSMSILGSRRLPSVYGRRVRRSEAPVGEKSRIARARSCNASIQRRSPGLPVGRPLIAAVPPRPPDATDMD